MDDLTPLMKQYCELKSQAETALLLFRMGDFYELFGEDATIASQILEITLTTREKNKTNPIPMAGVPHHSAQGYIQRLLNAGHKVAIAEQMTLPQESKTIVRREITRIFTPAVQFDQEGSDPTYLATVLPLDTQWILALLDVATGEVLISEPLSSELLALELYSPRVRHILRVGHQLPEKIPTGSRLLEDLPANYFSQEQASHLLKKHYGIENLEPFISTSTAVHTLGILVHYVLRTQQLSRLSHLRLPIPLHEPKTLVLGPHTPEHLEIPSLYQFINNTRSALGARKLRRWILEPLKNIEEIHQRQEAIRELSQSHARLERISMIFSKLYDLERISGRINAKLANPRDTLALGQSLQLLPKLLQEIETFQSPLLMEYRGLISQVTSALEPLSERILRIQREEAPITGREGGIFKTGADPELDHLLSLTENGERWLVDLEIRERELTDIPSLKVRYNRVFGYYIEVTTAHLKSVPSHYQRKQTMVGAERFFTEELKKFEEEILTASTKQKALEYQLFQELLDTTEQQTQPLMLAASLLAELDALTALGKLGTQPGWNFPEIDHTQNLEIESGRHPLVDQSLGQSSFVPNDIRLNETRRSLIITGPNMGGKSTVMRQVALIVLLGQMGAPVPALRARWGAFSGIYTRIGAQDAISRGQSTFMVEMSELAHILHHADERSLIILDEIGRGTSTYDGMSVAWATLEWICTQIKARTLFATHYHELTRLSETLPSVANVHMAVEKGKSLRFLYQLQEGPSSESFGIHVAKIAGLPIRVIDRSWEILEELETTAREPAGIEARGSRIVQLSLF